MSAGEGELLGVVIWPRPPALPSQGTVALLPPEIPNELRTLATQWGMDPIWTAQPLEVDTPITDHFTRAVATNSNLTLDELPGATVSVAGHRLGYDEDRQLWYCDIDIDVGDAYYPFIRLALARYQPDSVDDAHLSRVVLADFAQVAPNRTVSVAFASSPTDLIVTLARPGYERSAGVRDGAIVEVTVEQRIEGRPGDLGWAPVTDGGLPARNLGAAQRRHPRLDRPRGPARAPQLPSLPARHPRVRAAPVHGNRPRHREQDRATPRLRRYPGALSSALSNRPFFSTFLPSCMERYSPLTPH